MRNSDQPQNTEKLVRDAAVQICGEEKDVNKQGVVSRETLTEADKEVILKSTLIRYGTIKKVQERHPDWDNITAQPFAVYDLCAILADLTSSSKENREWAKRQVRELVRLGKEAME